MLFVYVFSKFIKLSWTFVKTIRFRMWFHVRARPGSPEVRLSKFQPPLTLGDPQNVEKVIRKLIVCRLESQLFRDVSTLDFGGAGDYLLFSKFSNIVRLLQNP